MDAKTKKKILRFLQGGTLLSMLAGLILTGASLMPNFGVQTISTQADTVSSANAQPKDRFISPATYEEYLPLSTPMDVAVSDDYTAIADGNTIYVYDRSDGIYRAYEHSLSATPAMNQITQLEFSSSGDLYFIDGAPYLYILNKAQLSSLDSDTAALNTHFTCSAFTLSDNRIYFTHISGTTANLSYTTLNRLETSAARSIVEGIPGSTKPTLTHYNNTVYYTQYTNLLKINPGAANAESEFVCGFDNAIESLIISGGEVFLTDEKGAFYAYNLAQLEADRHASFVTPTASDESGTYRALSLYGKNVYAVRNQGVREYKIGDGFTSYEIASNSDSITRLNGATDTLLKDGKLYTADTNNHRITIRSMSDGSYTASPILESPILVAATQSTYAAASAKKVWLFDADGNVQTFTDFSGKIVGLEGVYGKYYLVTDTNHYYLIEYLPLSNSDADSETEPIYKWQKSGGAEKAKKLSPQLLSSDVYGNLYVATQSGGLYKFKETTFINPSESGLEIYSSVPSSATSMAVDLDENVYIAKGNKLSFYKYDAATKTCVGGGSYPLSKKLAYRQDETTPVTSVTFDVNDKYAYVTYAGNFTLATTDVPFQTVYDVETQSVEKTIFGGAPATVKVVDVPKDAFLIRFDFHRLHADYASSSARYFEYETHYRQTQTKTALLLGTAGDYSVLSMYDKTTHHYETYLTKTKYYVTQKPQSDYLVTYPAGEERTGYLTNDISLYSYPFLTELLEVGTLKKGESVRLIGEINNLDFNYYKVLILTESGKEQIGYVPKSYLALFDGSLKDTTTTTYGDVSPDGDSLWRLTYLLLGTAAICVLVDLLILRKRNKEE